MTQAGMSPTQAVDAIDEYQNTREQHIADERPLTIYIDRQEIVTLMTLGCRLYNFYICVKTIAYIERQSIKPYVYWNHQSFTLQT